MQRSLSCSQLAVSARHNTTPPPLKRSSTSPTTGNRPNASSDIRTSAKRPHNRKARIIPLSQHNQTEILKAFKSGRRAHLRTLQQVVEESYPR